jgi:type I restriction enzyme M protein
MVRESLRHRFVEGLKEFGGGAGNARLQGALGWQAATYESVRAALIEEGVIRSGRGRGGSVLLADAEPPAAAPVPRAAPEERPAAARAAQVDRQVRAARPNTPAANVGYEAELWRMADALRGSMDAAEYKHVVLGLIFLKPRSR